MLWENPQNRSNHLWNGRARRTSTGAESYAIYHRLGTSQQDQRGRYGNARERFFVASSTVKGPDIRPAAVSSRISLSMISGCSVADGRFCGRKVDVNRGGLPIGGPSLMSCTQ